MSEKLIEFLRKRDYILVKELGQGACGKTVLLRDDLLDEYFVCKKYSPVSEALKQPLFSAFVREIKLLHRVHHPNVVRVFNYYLYPDQFTGFILMEYVEGCTIDEYLRRAPDNINEIFLQAVNGFRYLEATKILHRDIRPMNLLVGNDGTVKIIDLGFGKQIKVSEDFDKSISLNWWCDPPKEFTLSVYNFKTEVYFLGKLFEKLIQEIGIDYFEYKELLRRMCQWDPDQRIPSFFDVEKVIQNDKFFELDFSDEETECYRRMADRLDYHVTKIEHRGRYADDIERILLQLETAYRSCMLETTVPNAAIILRCFIEGTFYYRKEGFPVQEVRSFLQLLKSSTPEKRRTILANLHTRFDAIKRYTKQISDDNIPF